MTHRVALYYKYVPIDDYLDFADRHLAFCKQLGVLGRILVAPEGINGTVSGTHEQMDGYVRELTSDRRLSDVVFKFDDVPGHVFDKIFVRAKRELVTSRWGTDIDPNVVSGQRLSPLEFKNAMQGDDVVILDGRADYEYDIGHFRNAIRPDIATFREFQDWIAEQSDTLRDKRILTYCTGGVRCEKLSALLIQQGFENVFQLDGGIVTYGRDESTRGEMFEGKCYVFDKRIAIDVNSVDPSIVSHCKHCGELSDRYVNCVNLDCHDQFFCCEACDVKHDGSCSEECRVIATNDPRVARFATIGS